MDTQQTDWNESSEVFWTGQQRFRYFVSAVLLPLCAILCAYFVFKATIQLRTIAEVGVSVAVLTGWNETGYWIALFVHLCTSAAITRCCLTDRMFVPRYVRITLWGAFVLWAIIVAVTVVKIGLLTIAAAIVASTLLAAFALMGAVLMPNLDRNQSGVARFTILQLMTLTTVVAIVAAIALRFPRSESVEFWAVAQLGGALFRIFMLACPILACYAYFLASFDFRISS